MMDFKFEYNNIMYDNVEEVEEAVAEEVGQNMNNGDPYASGEYESELEDVDVYLNGEYWGSLMDYMKHYG